MSLHPHRPIEEQVFFILHMSLGFRQMDDIVDVIRQLRPTPETTKHMPDGPT